MECLSCYKTACDFVPNCMDLISASFWDTLTRWAMDRDTSEVAAASRTERG